jgi:hypothetical protein
MKIHPEGDELFHAYGRTDGPDEATVIVAFCNLCGSHLVVLFTIQTTLIHSRLNKCGLFGSKYETDCIKITITS